MKKKWIKSLIFFLFVCALGVAALYDSYLSEEKEKAAEESARLFPHKTEDVQEIRLKTGDGRETVLTREKQKWLMETPTRDFADPSAVTSWLDQLKDQKAQKITVEGAVKWEDFHLDGEKTPGVTLLLKSDKDPAEKVVFSVSRRPGFDGKYFIRRGDALLMGEGAFQSVVIEKDPDSFRSLGLIHLSGHPDKLDYRGGESFSFTWMDYNWAFKTGSPFPLNDSRLDKLWSDLIAFKAVKIAGPAKGRLKKYGLDRPRAEIRLNFGDQKLYVRVSAVREEKVFLYADDRDYVLECSKSQAEKLFLSQKTLRDHSAPFKYKKEEVSLIELKGGKYSYTAQKSAEGVWSAPSEAATKSAGSEKPMEREMDSKAIEAVLSGISVLRGEKYSSTPLRKAEMSLALKDDKGKTVWEMKAGRPFKDSSGKKMFWLQTSLSKDLTAVSGTALNGIFERDPYVAASKKEEDGKSGSDKKSLPKDKSGKTRPADEGKTSPGDLPHKPSADPSSSGGGKK